MQIARNAITGLKSYAMPAGRSSSGAFPRLLFVNTSSVRL
jgi:hypothetical protein